MYVELVTGVVRMEDARVFIAPCLGHLLSKSAQAFSMLLFFFFFFLFLFLFWGVWFPPINDVEIHICVIISIS